MQLTDITDNRRYRLVLAIWLVSRYRVGRYRLYLNIGLSWWPPRCPTVAPRSPLLLPQLSVHVFLSYALICGQNLMDSKRHWSIVEWLKTWSVVDWNLKLLLRSTRVIRHMVRHRPSRVVAEAREVTVLTISHVSSVPWSASFFRCRWTSIQWRWPRFL